MFSWYKYLIVSLVLSHLGFWSGILFLIAPFPDLCLLVLFFLIVLNCRTNISQRLYATELKFQVKTACSRHRLNCVSEIEIKDLKKKSE